MPSAPAPTSDPAPASDPDSHLRDDEVGELAARLRLGATRLARRLRSEDTTGLSPSLHSALAAVHVHGPVTLGALAEHEGVAPPSITKVVGRLEERGLVERIVDDADRRICRVVTTGDGEELLAASRAHRTAWLAARLTSLRAEQRAVLLAAVDVLDELVTGERTVDQGTGDQGTGEVPA